MAQVKPAKTAQSEKVVITNKSPTVPASGDKGIAPEELPPLPDDFYPMPNLKLTKITGPPDNIANVKEQLKAEIYTLSRAFFAALEKDRNLKFDHATLANDTAAAYYKSIQHIERFDTLNRRYESAAFRSFLIRRASKVFQATLVAQIEVNFNSIKSQNESLSEKILLLEKKANSNKTTDTFFRSPKNVFEIFSILALFGSIFGIYLIFARTY